MMNVISYILNISQFYHFGLIDLILKIPYAKYVSLILYCTGLFFISIAQFQLGDSFRLGLPPKSDNQFELINIGIYKYIRNPILFGWLILLLATFFIIPNFISIIVIITNYIFINIEIREEELYLYHRFKERYTTYYENTGRFFPYFKKQKFTATELYKYVHNII
jgi:protein-S-isoprenylcysteine O-methyltransferase Ste14